MKRENVNKKRRFVCFAAGLLCLSLTACGEKEPQGILQGVPISAEEDSGEVVRKSVEDSLAEKTMEANDLTLELADSAEELITESVVATGSAVSLLQADGPVRAALSTPESSASNADSRPPNLSSARTAAIPEVLKKAILSRFAPNAALFF